MKHSAERLKGKTALVTGAAKRLGRAIACALADAGMNLVVHYRSARAEAQSLCRELAAKGVDAWPLQADFGKPEEYESLIERALQTAGELHALVNNASIFPPEKLHSLTFEALLANLQVNAWAPFVLSRSFQQLVGRGKIVNLLDARIRGYDRYHVGYLLSKHLLTALTEMTALAYAPNLTVNAVAPGLILPPAGKGQDYLDRLAQSVPLRKHGQPEEVARAVVFLLQSDFITGQIIYVDGGQHLRGSGNGQTTD